MTVLVSHPTGNANTRAVLRGLEAQNMLAEFHTSLALPPGRWAEQIFGTGRARKLDQRRFPETPWVRQHLHPWPEVLRQWARRFGPMSLVQHERGLASVDAVYSALDKAVAARLRRGTSGIKAVYAYEDGALHSFAAACELGISRIYDLPSAHWRVVRKLLAEEAERSPDWASTLLGLKDSSEKLQKKDQEILTADHITVASSFCRASVSDHFETLPPMSVVAYGCPSPRVTKPAARLPGEALHIMFVGRLSQAKGLADLINALALLEIDWRLTLVGVQVETAPRTLEHLLLDERCSWIGTLPHASLMDHMTHAHVFVFPSLMEGFGMVITEALAAGLPVITTPHTAGPDILTEGKDGFIVPIRAPEVLADRITLLAEDEGLRYEMACNALSKAARSSWTYYETEIASLVREWTPE